MADIDFQNGFINGFVAGSTNIEVDMVNKRDTEANWQSINPIVANGEQVIVDTPDGVKIKIGDGVSHFNELEYTDKVIIEALDQKADKSEFSNVNAAQLNGKTATEIENTLKEYADEAANIVKNDLLNGAEDAYDTLKDLGDLINENTTALDALKLTASGKADLIHSHEISDVNELSTSLNKITEDLGKKVDSTKILPIVQDSIRAEAGPNIGTVGTPSVSSRIDGDDVVFTFDYLKGAKGNDGGKGDKGDPGVSATHSWDGTTLSVTSASGTSSADLKGEKGDPGTSATHSWDGTTLSITSASGTTSANLKGEKGDNGVGISKIEQTTTSNVDGGENIITATLSNNQKSTFTIKNGSSGSDGARGSLWFSGTGITGTSTTADIFTNSGVTSANVNDYFLNTSTGYVYKCTTGGNMQTAKWMYVGSVKGATGASFSSATDLYYAKSNTTAPSAPTSAVTTNTADTYNAWTKALPTYNASYPYYFTCVETLYTDGTRNWSTPVYAGALTSANQVAASASSNLATHTNNTTIHVTQADKNNWNAKSAFSGKYGDLTEKPTLIGKSGTGNCAEVFNDYRARVALGGSIYVSEGNTASGYYSHAEGCATTASGSAAHSEGTSTIASGNLGSHAEGRMSVASGETSHVEGEGTIAASNHQHVQGKFNIEDTANKYAHIVGNGDNLPADSRSNAHTLDWNGKAWFASDVCIGGTGQDSATTSLSAVKTTANTANTNASTALSTANSAKTLAEGALPLSGGTMTGDIIMPAVSGHAIKPAQTNYGSVGTADRKFYQMYAETFYGKFSGTHTGSFDGTNYRGTTFTGCAAGTNYGTCSTAASTAQKAVTLSLGEKGEAYSYYTSRTGTRITVKFTYGNTASNPSLYVNNFYDSPIYYKGAPLTPADSWKAGDIVDFICEYISAKWVVSMVKISGSSEGGVGSSGTGSNSEIFNDYTNNIATGSYAHAEGYNTKASGSYSHAEGTGTKASDQYAHAEGSGTTASNLGAHAEGSGTTASGYDAHAEGSGTTASNNYTHAEGFSTEAKKEMAHAEGYFSVASGRGSHAEGHKTNSEGEYSHAEGSQTTAKGTGSHAEGNNTVADGQYGAHAEGFITEAKGTGSHAEGYEAKALGDTSHAEGFKTIASGDYSHVQGKYNIEDTENKYAHIVGNGAYQANSNAHTLDWNGVGWFAGGVSMGMGNMEDGITLSPVVEQVTIQTPVTQTMTKYAHTPNVSDAGVQNGNYENNYTNTQVVTIPGASSLNVEITYQTESLTYDWVCVFQGAHSDYTAQTSGYLKKLGGSTKTKESFTVTGESVTFAFRSDTSQNAFYGYYAVVTGVGTTYTSTTEDKATGLWVKGDIYTGENNPSKLGGATKITFSSYSNTTYKFSDGTTYQDVINLIEQGKEVILVYNVSSTQTRYYSYVRKYSDAYYFSCPAANAGYYDARLASTYFYSFETDMTEVQTYSSTSTSTHYLTGRTGTSNDQCDLYFSTLVYMTPSSGYLYAKSHVTSSADYAEYYEWEDGNPNNEDRRGHFVTFAEGNKIRIANNTDDYILGVVSVSPAVLGNDYDSEWCGKYLTDAFGKVLTEEVFVEEYTNEETGEIIPTHMETIPILNPDYDESQEYISREKRKEWVPIGTHGQLILIDNGLCEVGRYCMPGEDGTAVPSDQKEYRIIERLDDSHIKIVIK